MSKITLTGSVSQLRKSVRKKMSRPTQNELSRILGISPSYLSLILRNKRNPKNVTDILSRVAKEMSK
jgi:transcriptional regulator with XRE-family HTH domain